MPEEKQKVIKSLPESRVSKTSGAGFDDVIAGKGQGVIVLLHGPPGVAKILTAEAIAEHLKQLHQKQLKLIISSHDGLVNEQRLVE
ncbi:hypothetical protein PAAG_07362 [Paracoccidioides lutzii Pb01]|uniref:ATPase AAA-type core domain-containing protein n=1 Tax=Paracoccidioides lutzii (strain ATCC MYA-826 / Pb01) TaxID=502779 RepID=C1H9C1_PARBA|nr:hypothetical protein PAAG_07362 [Paracoccidioides lutzii Pb01]EEH36944.2 hypothetical protein PAAG_07362 [Paracoccidioides lutzii Pb01]